MQFITLIMQTVNWSPEIRGDSTEIQYNDTDYQYNLQMQEGAINGTQELLKGRSPLYTTRSCVVK